MSEVFKKRYLTNLNTCQNYGLNHELWCIVDALMIGESTERNIMVTGFYPDYNSKFTIDLNEVIDIQHTNENLLKNGFSVQLQPYDKDINWVSTKYKNPVFGHFDSIKGKQRYLTMIEALKQEDSQNIDLFTTFVWPIPWAFGHDKELMDKATQMFLCLSPSQFIESCVKERVNFLNLADSYFVIHLRLEDDWVTHLTSKYKGTCHFGKTEESFSHEMFDSIINILKKQNDSEEIIFLATGLGKTSHKNNHMIQNMKEIFGDHRIKACKQGVTVWKEKYPGIGDARELEGYIDFLICLKAKRAILATHSSFSVSLKFCRDMLHLESELYPG